MNISLSPKEEELIKQTAQQMNITPEMVIIQAIRLFLLWRMNKIQLIWPHIVDHKIIEVDPNPDPIGTTVDVTA